MDKERKEELKKNDLADVIEGKLVAMKPYAGTIGLVSLLLAAVVGGGLWMLISGQNKKEKAWTDLYTASYEAQTNNSTKLLDQTASNPESVKTLPGLWARQMAADAHLNEGLFQLSGLDREKGMEKVAEALDEFKSVAENTDKVGHQLLWSRATYGMARAAESTGDFETAKAAYQSIIAEMGESPLAEAAAEKIEVLNDPVTLAWFNEFKTRKNEVRQSGETGEAPESDTGLPARPDFSFPEIEVPDPASISGEAPPAPPEGDSEESSEESPPAPPEATESQDEGEPEMKEEEATPADEPEKEPTAEEKAEVKKESEEKPADEDTDGKDSAESEPANESPAETESEESAE